MYFYDLDSEGNAIRRKKSSVTSALRKVSTYIMPFDAEIREDRAAPSSSNGSYEYIGFGFGVSFGFGFGLILFIVVVVVVVVVLNK